MMLVMKFHVIFPKLALPALLIYHFVSYIKPQELLSSHQAVLSILKSDNYSNNVVPTVNGPLKVFLNLGLRSIQDLSDKTMELTVQMSLRQKWTDYRLQFRSQDPTSYITLNEDAIPKPWTPDIFIQNEKVTVVHRITKPNSFIRVYPNGTMFYSTRVSLTISCFMNLRQFPFDKQSCKIRMSSYAHTIQTVAVDWDSDVSIEELTNVESEHLAHFRIMGHSIGRCTIENTSGKYGAVYITLAFKRQLAYYNIQVFVPCTMLIMITWVALWLGNALEVRLSLTVTVLLTLATLIAGTSQSLAQVSYSTGYTYFIGTCLMFATLSILQSATVFFVQREGNFGWITKSHKVARNIENKLEKGNMENYFGNLVMNKNGVAEKLSEKAERFDKISQKLFPALFVFLMAVYFGVYLWDYDDLGEEFSKIDKMNESEKPCAF